MTNRERAFAALGIEYAEGIDQSNCVTVPATGRQVRRNAEGFWEAQPFGDNYYLKFADLLDALRAATPPEPPPPGSDLINRVEYSIGTLALADIEPECYEEVLLERLGDVFPNAFVRVKVLRGDQADAPTAACAYTDDSEDVLPAEPFGAAAVAATERVRRIAEEVFAELCEGGPDN